MLTKYLSEWMVCPDKWQVRKSSQGGGLSPVARPIRLKESVEKGRGQVECGIRWSVIPGGVRRSPSPKEAELPKREWEIPNQQRDFLLS